MPWEDGGGKGGELEGCFDAPEDLIVYTSTKTGEVVYQGDGLIFFLLFIFIYIFICSFCCGVVIFIITLIIFVVFCCYYDLPFFLFSGQNTQEYQNNPLFTLYYENNGFSPFMPLSSFPPFLIFLLLSSLLFFSSFLLSPFFSPDPGINPVCVLTSDPSIAWFNVLEQYYDLGWFLSSWSLVCIYIYFVTRYK